MNNDRKLAAALGALLLEQTANNRLEAAIRRVRELHALEEFDDAGVIDEICAECREFYPCETIQALDGEAND